MQAVGRGSRVALLIGLGALSLTGLALAKAEGLWSLPTPAREAPWRLTLSLRPEESLRQGLLRAGLGLGDVQGAVTALADAGTASGAGSDLKLDAKVERGAAGGLRLIQLGLDGPRSGGETLTRAADGSFRVNDRSTPEPPAPAARPRVVQGPIEEILFGDRDGHDAPIRAKAAQLFGERLDLARDVELGDRVRLVYAQGERPRLIYAEIDTQKGATQLYWRPRGSDQGEFIDQTGEPVGHGLMRTPVAIVRITSRFGLRRHPLLGYVREHQGLDFGAPAGSPVLAAADGKVEQARWAGGYGRWILLRHSADLETAYGHLSAWAPGLRDGEQVRRGQVIGFVGATGLATGPHLHFEVRRDGRPIDPSRVADPNNNRISRLELADFEAQRDRMAAFLAGPDGRNAQRF